MNMMGQIRNGAIARTERAPANAAIRTSFQVERPARTLGRTSMNDSNSNGAEQRTARAIAAFQGDDEGRSTCRLLKRAAAAGGSCFFRQ